MKQKWFKGILPLVILAIGFGGMSAIKASGEKDVDKEPVDVRPTVKIETAIAEDYQVRITSYGEVSPLESTMISAQVSGEVLTVRITSLRWLSSSKNNRLTRKPRPTSNDVHVAVGGLA